MLHGKWEPQGQHFHINLLEMRAVAKALLGFSFPPGATVLVSSGSCFLHKQGGGTCSLSLWKVTELMFQLVINLQISIQGVHIPGKMNVITNLLSCQDQTLPMELDTQPGDHLFLLWGSPHVDLFATRLNTKLPTFVSLVPDPQVLAVDALSLSWQNLWAYAFPLHQLLTKVLIYLPKSNTQLLLMAPAWPAQLWFQDLLDLSVNHPRQLLVMKTLLR